MALSLHVAPRACSGIERSFSRSLAPFSRVRRWIRFEVSPVRSSCGRVAGASGRVCCQSRVLVTVDLDSGGDGGMAGSRGLHHNVLPPRIVESVGEGVNDLQSGDHVLPVFTGECGDCPHCKSEESNMCDLLRINTNRGVMLSDGKSCFSVNGKPITTLGTSTFSEYAIVHVDCLAKINPAVPLDKVCVLSCGITTGLGATLNVAKPKKGNTVAIFGLGAIG